MFLLLDKTTCPNYCFQVHFTSRQRVHLSKGRQREKEEAAKTNRERGQRRERRLTERLSKTADPGMLVEGATLFQNICCSVGTATGQPSCLLANPYHDTSESREVEETPSEKE